MWMVLCLIFAVTFISICLHYFGRKNEHNLVKGPKGLPFVGLGFDFILSDPVGTFERINKIVTEWKGLLRVNLGHHKLIFVTIPEDIEVIMTDQRFLRKSTDYDLLRPWLQDGLLTVSDKTKWYTRRRTLTPAFHFKILDEFINVFEQQANILVNTLLKCANEGAIDICQYINLYTLDVICETSMGVKLNALTDKESQYVLAVKEISKIIFWRMHHFLARDEWFWRLTPQKRRHDELLKVIYQFTISVIEKRRKEKSKMDFNENTVQDEFGIKRRPALLDILLESKINGMPLTTKDIQEEVDSFMFAGHDTTTSSIQFLLYNIAKYPEVQEKVYNEIIEVFDEDFSNPITTSNLNDLSYLDIVMKESLRLFPPVPMIARRLEESVTVNGQTYPARHDVIMGIYLLHRDPKFYADPLVFKPERFLEQKCHEKVNAFSFIPFAGGYRNCIGQKFAQYEIKTVISKLIYNYDIQLISKNFEPKLAAEIILRPANGIWLKFNKRNRK